MAPGFPRQRAIAVATAVGLAWLMAMTPEQARSEDKPETPQEGVSEELQLLKEEETVSTASRYEQPISHAPSNVYVITDEDIRQSGAPDLPTILRRIPGIEVMQISAAEFNVSARGDNQPVANKMLVLVDGRSIYVDVQGTVFWKMIPVTLPEIKRIEVLKGPAAAVYGFNAFDGVVNIITKSPDEMKGTTVQFGGGEFGTISSAAIQAGTHGKFGYRLSIGHDQTQEWRNRNALAFRADKFNVQTEYNLPGDSKVMVSGGLVDANRFDGPIAEIVSASSQPAQSYVYTAYERPRLFLRGWWSGFTSTTLDTPVPQLANFILLTDRNGSSKFSFVGNTYNIEAQHQLEFGPANRLTYGINYRHNSLSSDAIVAFTREDRLGLYAQHELTPLDAFTVVAGLRFDMDTFINPTISPRLALLYRPAQDHTLRASISVGYRPPTIFERTFDERVITTLPLPPPFNTTTTVFTGSTRLSPEEIVSYELSYQGWYFKHRLRARLDLFFNHLSNLIGNRATAVNSASFVNDPGVADIYGGEAGIEFLATRWLTGFANYAYEEIGQSFTGTVRRGAPRDKVNVGLRTDLDNGLSGEAALHYVSATTYPVAATFTNLAPFGVIPPNPTVDSYTLLNLRGGYRFWQQKAAAGYMREAEVAVSAFNALNDKHKEHPLGDEIGSRVMGWLTLKF